MIKKSLFILLIINLLTVLLTGCHGKKGLPEFIVPDTFDTNRQFNISFWAKNDTNIAQTKIYEKAIDNFEKIYPNVKINMRLYTDYSRIYNDVITNISTNTTPNVCITYPDHIATYKTGDNCVLPLDKIINNSKYGLGGNNLKFDGPKKSEIIEKFLNECVIDQEIFALPFMRSTEVCYMNADIINQLGYVIPEILTWDFIWEVSEAAMAKNDDGTFKSNNQKIMIPFIYKSTDNMIIQMLKQKNANYSDKDGNIQLFNNTTREILQTIALHSKTKAFSTFKISSYPGNFLNAGQCVFAIDSTAGSTWMGSNAPLSDICSDNIKKFNTEVRMIPQFDPDHPKMISQGPSVCVFNKSDNQEVLASWLFAQYLLTNDVQTAYAETEGYVPVTTKARNSNEYKDYLSLCGIDNNVHYDVKIKATELLLNCTQYTFVTPVFNGSASLRSAAGELVETTVKSVNRKIVVDDKFFDRLFEDVVALFHLNNNVSINNMNLGPFPKAATILLIILAVLWICIIFKFLNNIIQKNSRRRSRRWVGF